MQSLVMILAAVCVHTVWGSGYQQKQQQYYHKPSKYCFQCAYSPPKTYYDKKVVYESSGYGYQNQGHKSQGYGNQGYGNQGYGNQGGYQGGYQVKKTYVPVPYTVQGGWDKCKDGFDYHTAQKFGIDVWDCHSNCYVRVDKNKNVYRGCYKGEYGVDPYKLGCHKQGEHGSTYCFCEGSKCNNFDAPVYS